MNLYKLNILIGTFLIMGKTFAQLPFKEYKVGHEFFINLPEYLDKTVGLNTVAEIQFKSITKDIYGFIIDDSKEELNIAQTRFSSISEYYDFFVKDFLIDQEKKEYSRPQIQGKNKINYLESTVSYYNKDVKTDICCFIGMVETERYFYKILIFTSVRDKDKYKEDFEKILYSLRD